MYTDIIYKDKLVTILHPKCNYGVLVYTRYTQPKNCESLCKIGLKTGKRLKEENIDFNRNIYHPYIFFRAPCSYNKIDYSNIETQINSSYTKNFYQTSKNMIYIRVDPKNTYVFSSEIRNIFTHINYYKNVDTIINNSKKTLDEYLEILKYNDYIKKTKPKNMKILYNLFSSKATLFPENYNTNSPFDIYDICYNSEILVSIPHLTPDYFVHCT